MKLYLTLLLITFSFGAFAQEILLEQNVKADTIRPTHGPNLKHFKCYYLGLSFPIYTNEEKNYTIPGLSSSFDFGMRYKRKFNNLLACGLDLGLNSTAYKIKQNDSKSVPDTISNDKEKFQINTLTGSAFVRFNVGRRGNYIGNYLDLGGYAGWNMIKRHKTTNIVNDERVKVATTRLKYVEDISYGVLARVGINKLAVSARYRLSNIFKSSYDMPELPRLSLGFELSLFK